MAGHLLYFSHLFSLLILLFLNVGYVYQLQDDQKINTALVLGAGVSDNGAMSPFLKDRADAALYLYNQNQIQNILVSGDNSRSSYDEVEPVKDYLLSQGVFSGDIYLDYAGFDTYDSVYRARHIFGQDELVIISQKYHVPRAVTLARGLGIQAYGYPSKTYDGTPHNKLREIVARVKILLDFTIFHKPTLLGEPIVIE